MSSTNEKFSAKNSKDTGADKEQNCVTFEPQTWRRHVCKNCFRTRPDHGAPPGGSKRKSSADGGAAGPVSNVSSMAAKFGQKAAKLTDSKPRKNEKRGWKGNKPNASDNAGISSAALSSAAATSGSCTTGVESPKADSKTVKSPSVAEGKNGNNEKRGSIDVGKGGGKGRNKRRGSDSADNKQKKKGESGRKNSTPSAMSPPTSKKQSPLSPSTTDEDKKSASDKLSSPDSTRTKNQQQKDPQPTNGDGSPTSAASSTTDNKDQKCIGSTTPGEDSVSSPVGTKTETDSVTSQSNISSGTKEDGGLGLVQQRKGKRGKVQKGTATSQESNSNEKSSKDASISQDNGGKPAANVNSGAPPTSEQVAGGGGDGAQPTIGVITGTGNGPDEVNVNITKQDGAHCPTSSAEAEAKGLSAVNPGTLGSECNEVVCGQDGPVGTEDHQALEQHQEEKEEEEGVQVDDVSATVSFSFNLEPQLTDDATDNSVYVTGLQLGEEQQVSSGLEEDVVVVESDSSAVPVSLEGKEHDANTATISTNVSQTPPVSGQPTKPEIGDEQVSSGSEAGVLVASADSSTVSGSLEGKEQDANVASVSTNVSQTPPVGGQQNDPDLAADSSGETATAAEVSQAPGGDNIVPAVPDPLLLHQQQQDEASSDLDAAGLLPQPDGSRANHTATTAGPAEMAAESVEGLQEDDPNLPPSLSGATATAGAHAVAYEVQGEGALEEQTLEVEEGCSVVTTAPTAADATAAEGEEQGPGAEGKSRLEQEASQQHSFSNTDSGELSLKTDQEVVTVEKTLSDCQLSSADNLYSDAERQQQQEEEQQASPIFCPSAQEEADVVAADQHHSTDQISTISPPVTPTAPDYNAPQATTTGVHTTSSDPAACSNSSSEITEGAYSIPSITTEKQECEALSSGAEATTTTVQQKQQLSPTTSGTLPATGDLCQQEIEGSLHASSDQQLPEDIEDKQREGDPNLNVSAEILISSISQVDSQLTHACEEDGAVSVILNETKEPEDSATCIETKSAARSKQEVENQGEVISADTEFRLPSDKEGQEKVSSEYSELVQAESSSNSEVGGGEVALNQPEAEAVKGQPSKEQELESLSSNNTGLSSYTSDPSPLRTQTEGSSITASQSYIATDVEFYTGTGVSGVSVAERHIDRRKEEEQEYGDCTVIPPSPDQAPVTTSHTEFSPTVHIHTVAAGKLPVHAATDGGSQQHDLSQAPHDLLQLSSPQQEQLASYENSFLGLTERASSAEQRLDQVVFLFDENKEHTAAESWGDKYSESSPLDASTALQLSGAAGSSENIILLENIPTSGQNLQAVTAGHQQQAGFLFAPTSPHSQSQSSDDADQWFETVAELPPPPSAFSDNTVAAPSPSATELLEPSQQFQGPTLGGDTEQEATFDAHATEGSGTSHVDAQLGPSAISEGSQLSSTCGKSDLVQEGEIAISITGASSTTSQEATAGGLLAIAVPGPQGGFHQGSEQFAGLSVQGEYYSSSTQEAFSPVVVRGVSNAEPQQDHQEQLRPTGTTSVPLSPLSIDVTTVQPPPAQPQQPIRAPSSDATGGGELLIAPQAGAQGWSTSTPVVVGEQLPQQVAAGGAVQQLEGEAGVGGGSGDVAAPPGPQHWSISSSSDLTPEHPALVTAIAAAAASTSTSTSSPPPPEGGGGEGVAGGSASAATATPLSTTTAHYPSVTAPPADGKSVTTPTGEGQQQQLNTSSTCSISSVPSVSLQDTATTTTTTGTLPSEPTGLRSQQPQQTREPEVLIECEPVRASTFSPRVSLSPRISTVSPSGVTGTTEAAAAAVGAAVSPTTQDVKVAAATISLRQPSVASSSAAATSPLSSKPSFTAATTTLTQQQKQSASSTRSTPSPRGISSTEDATEEKPQTCVSTVKTFIISSAKTPGKETPPPAISNGHPSVKPGTNKYDDDSADEALADGYGGFPTVSNHRNQQQNGNKSPSVEQEDITTIATVNVSKNNSNGSNKPRRVRQRPVQPLHQQLQFDRTFTRSSSVPDNSIFQIASHKPDSSDTSGGFGTLQFGPSGRQRRRRMSDAFIREDAMMEGTRMLIENLREKQHLLEEKCARLEREKNAVTELLTDKKSEMVRHEERFRERINSLEITCSRLDAENCRLLDRLNLPETDRNNFRDQELELNNLRRKLLEAEEVIGQLTEDSASLQHEVKDMHLEMEEMHDQFRDDEALEFRDMQKELEATAKNCRILQFKLRKAERRNDAMQSERVHFEEKIRQLECRSNNTTEQNQIRELEEELRMAKEVSVRLHDELEATEERRAKFQEELERVHDLLLDSEKGRGVLQKELLTLTEEVELLRERIENKDDVGEKLDVPKPKGPTLGRVGSQGSTEVDVEQLMRDLADSLEREHDLKGQLEHAEEETINYRKKLSDLEDENEVIQIQLQKMSAAKSGKYFQKSLEDKDVVTEAEHETRLQLELAEEEINVLRRKVDETDAENTNMKREVRRLQLKLAGKDSKEIRDDEQLEDTRSYDERISAMATDIDELKWRLIQKDQESAQKDNVEREEHQESETVEDRRPMKLSKSMSLDSGDFISSDVHRQLDMMKSETVSLQDKITELEKENEDLKAKTRQMDLQVPTITTDDSALRNIELQDKIQSLESDNSGLRDTIRSLDDRTTALSKEVNRVNKCETTDRAESSEMKEQLRRLEADVSRFQKMITDLQESNQKLATDLKQYEQTDEGKNAAQNNHRGDDVNIDTANKMQLREKIKDLESEIRHLQSVVKNREEETARMEREVNDYRDDMDKMLESFKEREAFLQVELQSWEQKNAVLSNLLDLVTERAESIQSEKRSQSQSQSERSASVVSDTTMGSDEVFGDKADDDQDWNEKLLCRIRSLEDLLKEERQKVQAVEKRLSIKDGQQSALTDDMKLHEREKEILQQEQKQKQILEEERAVIQEELALCQRQLSETTEQSEALRDKLDKMHKIQNILRQDFQRVTKELEGEKTTSGDLKQKLEAKEAESKKTAKDEKPEEKKAATGGRDAKFIGVGGLKDKEPASWRWEKQDLERTIKDLRKKSDELHKQLSRQQVRVKMAGDDAGRPRVDSTKTKELQTEIQTLKDEADKRKDDISKMDIQIKELQETLKSREEQWDTERDVLEGDRTAVIKESTQKDEVIKAKDEIIKQKNSLLQQKETALKERENSMLTHDVTLKEKDAAIESLQQRLNEVMEELGKIREEVKHREESQREMELKIKELNAVISARDGRIKEKDDILENINRNMSEKESNISDMDNTIRQAMKSIEEKEQEIKKLSGELETLRTDLTSSRSKSDDFERNLHKTEKEHGKEIASLVILREKMEAHIQQLNTEKNLAESEQQELKRVMMEKEDFWRSCRNELETELRNANEKLHLLESAKSGNQSDTIMKLSVEKDDLLNEKNILVKEVKRLVRELENAEIEWQQERQKYSHQINSKEDEVKDLKTKLSRQPSLPESQQSEGAEASSKPAPDARSEIIRKAEMASLEELYENKLRIAREQLRQAEQEMTRCRREVQESRELLMASQKSLSEVKHKYDVTVTTWHDEKMTLERRALENDERRRQVDALQRVVEHLEEQLRQLEAERDDLNARTKKIQADSDAERLSLQAQLNKIEEQSALTSSGKFKWNEKQKRESAWEKERSDQQRALTEYQNLVRDLEVRVRTAERTRDRDQKELLNKLESARKTMDRENNDLRKRCTQNEEKSKQVAGLQKTLIDLQYKLQSDREVWLRERSELQRHLSDAEKAKLEEKKKFYELLAEVKKVKELTPLLVKSEGDVEVEVRRKPGSSPLLSPVGSGSPRSLTPSGQYEQHPTDAADVVRTIPIRRLVDEALQRISQLAEDLNKTDIKRSSRPTAPPAFRRSLSTSEVEEYRDYVHQQLQEEEDEEEETRSYHINSATPNHDQSQQNPATTRQSAALSSKPPSAPPGATTPSADGVSPDDQQGRGRSSYRRAFPEFRASGVGAGGGTGRASRPGSARSSMHASGTQSAYSSRDASPERRKLGVKKITPYPVAPPSFLITPSRTPRRVTASMDREISMPETHLQRLYDKLSAIEKEQTTEQLKKQERFEREGSVEAYNDAIDSRRKSGMRMLVKSMSVDSYRDDPSWMPSEAERDPNAHFCPKQLDTVFDDAPKSQTLPASVRVGEFTIVPGTSEVATGYRESRLDAFTKRRQSQDARKNFYDNYPLYSSGFFSWPRKSRRDRVQEEDEELIMDENQETHNHQQQQQQHVTETKPQSEVAAAAPQPKQQQQQQQQQQQAATAAAEKAAPKKIHVGKNKKIKEKKEKEEKEKKDSKFSFFFSSVKERRSMFMKKSRSVDESPVRKSVMNAGLQAGRPAAPSTFEAPKEQETAVATSTPASVAPSQPTSSSTSSSSRPSSTSLRAKLHKRAASLDVSSLFSISSSTGGGGGSHSSSSAAGTSGNHNVTSSTSSAAGSGSRDQSRDGTYRVADFEVPPSSPSLTSNNSGGGFQRVRAQPGRRPPSRWRTPSMEKASQRPLIIKDTGTDRVKVKVKRRSLSESNVVFLQHMQASKVWSFSETRV